MNTTHPLPGNNSARQSIGLQGHCDDCVRAGHVAAHPDLGCSDVGCTVPHGPDQGTDHALKRLNSITDAQEYLLVQRTAAAFAVIGHAAAEVGAASVSIEFSPVDRGYSLHDAAGDEIEYDRFLGNTDAAIHLALDEVDDRRPSLLRPYDLDLDIDRHTGEVNEMTVSVATLIAERVTAPLRVREAGEVQRAAAALDELAQQAHREVVAAS